MTKRFIILKVIGGIIFISIGILMLIAANAPVDSAKFDVKEDQLITLTSYLTEDPMYFSSGGKNSSKYVQVKLNNYPDANFENDDEFLNATNHVSLKREVRSWDTVSIKVLRRDFEKYYLNRDSLSFWQIANNITNKIPFYSLTYKGKEYVANVYQSAKDHQSDNYSRRALFAFIFIGIGIYCFFAKK